MTGRSKGFGFVEMGSEEETRVYGSWLVRRMEVGTFGYKQLTWKSETGGTEFGDDCGSRGKKLYIGNLSY